MTVHDLREVLRERAEDRSPANPHRHDQVRARIRRVRVRRRVTAGAAVVAALAAGVALLPGVVETPRRETTAAAQPDSELPERFAAGDGAEYRRLATAALAAGGEKATSITFPVSGKPLDVAAICDGPPGSATPRIAVDGRQTGVHGFSPCMEPGMQLRALPVPEGATEVTVTFDTTTSGSGCVRKRQDGPCVAVTPKRADWSLAVYEWTPPARPVEPEQVRAFPTRLGGMRLATSRSGVWGEERDFSVTVTSGGGKLGIEQLCTGELAGRMWFSYTIDGRDTQSTVSCATWTRGPYPMAMQEYPVPKGKRVTVTGKMGIYGGHINRPVRWSIGVYTKEKQ
ncbi:hypothetical protein [Nonomuraea zeae]|uniref:Uncharacterized protein n=1 Tax=Nonomuraea zeae TaxID=1642303 RepID=A0A5S4FT31_9ACTN|nr:hypothetical protein [Nonomuraea zeae]TMR23524.1 hypothetical protein ETD85_47745 [Nonomuraea zeae]